MNGKNLLLLLLILLSLFFIGCPQTIFTPPDPVLPLGSMLVRHGPYLYKLGGTDQEGQITNKVYYSPVDVNGNPLQWQETTSIPSNRAFGVAFAVGNMIYVLGGTDGESSKSTIYYTYINPNDGSVGFPATVKFWETNPISLPEGIAHAGHIIHDGRIFLIGGVGSGGVLDQIIHARVHDNAFIGQWYISPQHLPTPLFNMGVVFQTNSRKLIVTGGTGSNGAVVDESIGFQMGEYGLLDDIELLPNLPQPLTSPIAISTDLGVMVAGGLDAELQISDMVYQLVNGGSAWTTLMGESLEGEGPCIGQVFNRIWPLTYESNPTIGQTVSTYTSDEIPADVPNVIPGSGYVASNTRIMVKAQPGVVVKYRNLGDMNWNALPSDFRITGHLDLEFGNDIDGTVTGIIERRYRVRSLGGFVFHISGSIDIQDYDGEISELPLNLIYLRDEIGDADSTPMESVWVKLRLVNNEQLTMYFKDSTLEGNELVSPFTGTISLSLYEDDFMSPALDVDGFPIEERTVSDVPLSLALQKGTYYLRLTDADGTAGTSLGLVVVRQ